MRTNGIRVPILVAALPGHSRSPLMLNLKTVLSADAGDVVEMWLPHQGYRAKVIAHPASLACQFQRCRPMAHKYKYAYAAQPSFVCVRGGSEERYYTIPAYP